MFIIPQTSKHSEEAIHDLQLQASNIVY